MTDDEYDRDFAIAMRAIAKIVTMPTPHRETTSVPVADLKAFARVITEQCTRIATAEARLDTLRDEVSASLTELKEARADRRGMLSVLAAILDTMPGKQLSISEDTLIALDDSPFVTRWRTPDNRQVHFRLGSGARP
jgi:hypothetical protein